MKIHKLQNLMDDIQSKQEIVDSYTPIQEGEPLTLERAMKSISYMQSLLEVPPISKIAQEKQNLEFGSKVKMELDITVPINDSPFAQEVEEFAQISSAESEKKPEEKTPPSQDENSENLAKKDEFPCRF